MKQLKEIYGKSKKSRALYNAAIRAEYLCGNEILDLLEFVNMIRAIRDISEREKTDLQVIEDKIQNIRSKLVEDIKARYTPS